MNKLFLLIAATLIGFSVLLSFKSYDKSSGAQSPGLTGLEMRSKIPLPGLDTIGYFEGIRRYYQKDSIIVFVHPVERYRTERDLSSNDGSKDSVIKIGETNRYFVYRVNASQGIRYDSLSVKGEAFFSVDSLLKHETITDFDPFYTRVMANDSLVEGKWSEDRRNYTEKYISKTKKDETYGDSTILAYSSAFDKYFFSLSPCLEKAKGIKLKSFKLIYNGTPGSSIRSFRIPRQVLIEINEMERIDDPDIEEIFSRFAKEEHKIR
ncbi:MAG: hypothetical protein QM781_10145 [Chitinophagaceae bacterium]